MLLVYLIMPKGEAGQYDEFAQCLTEKGAVMYGTDWCPYCKNQKAMFGASFKNIDYVNCDFSKAECDKNGVTGYPTWKVGGQSFSGVQPLTKLGSLAGCEI